MHSCCYQALLRKMLLVRLMLMWPQTAAQLRSERSGDYGGEPSALNAVTRTGPPHLLQQLRRVAG